MIKKSLLLSAGYLFIACLSLFGSLSAYTARVESSGTLGGKLVVVFEDRSVWLVDRPLGIHKGDTVEIGEKDLKSLEDVADGMTYMLKHETWKENSNSFMYLHVYREPGRLLDRFSEVVEPLQTGVTERLKVVSKVPVKSGESLFVLSDGSYWGVPWQAGDLAVGEEVSILKADSKVIYFVRHIHFDDKIVDVVLYATMQSPGIFSVTR